MRRALTTSLVLAFAWTLGVQQSRHPHHAHADANPTNEVFYSALGASDGIGFGGTVPCIPFDPDCPSGTGYVYVIKRRFQSDGKTVIAQQPLGAWRGAQPGDPCRSARDIGRNDIPGNFVDQIVPFVPDDDARTSRSSPAATTPT